MATTGFIRSTTLNRKRKQRQENDSNNEPEQSYTDNITITPLNMKNIVPEMLFMGCIKEILDDHMVISLPDNIHGYVYTCDINDFITAKLETKLKKHKSVDNKANISLIKLSKYFHIGQYICCTIVGCDDSGKKSNRLRLSIKPSDVYTNLQSSDIRKGMVLWGYISSDEDHGYEISFGSKLLKGFLKCKDRRKIGKMGFFLISSKISSGRLYIVTDSFKTMNGFNDIPFNSILPGNSVKALIVDNQTLGDVAKIFNVFDASISNLHLNDFKHCDINSTVDATVIFVDPLSKRIGLSVSNHLKNGTWFVDKTVTDHINNRLNMIGETVSGSIINVLQCYGVVLNLDNIPDVYGVLTKLWMNYPSNNGVISENYCHNASLNAKIIAYNRIDNFYILSDKSVILKMPFLTYSTVVVGSMIEGDVLTISDISIIVEFGGILRGILPVFLTKGKDPKKTLMEHKSIKCRVIECDPLKEKILLTSLPDMMNDRSDILTSYEDAKPGMSFLGFVIHSTEKYCIVKFYNGVTGILFKKHADASLTGKSFCSIYKCGKILKVFIYKCKPKDKILHLTLRDNSDFLTNNIQPDPSIVHYKDDIDQSSTSEIHLNNALLVNILSYDAPSGDGVKIRLSKNEKFQQLTRKKYQLITKQHLSDFCSISSVLVGILKRGGKNDYLDKAVILGRNNDSTLMITMKKLFIDNTISDKLPTKYEDLHIGQILPGVISNVMENGLNVLVGFSLVGYLPIKNISSEYISSIESSYQMGETILVTIDELLTKSRRFTLSLAFNTGQKSTHKSYCDYYYHGVGYLEYYLQQRSLIDKILSGYSIDTFPKVGQIVELTITKIKPLGRISCKFVNYSLECKVVYLEYYTDMFKKSKLSQHIKGQVVNVDVIDKVAYVIATPVVYRKKKLHSKIPDDKCDDQITNTHNNVLTQTKQLTVVYINEDNFICVDLNEKPFCSIFYGVGKKAFGDRTNLSHMYAIGQLVSGVVSRVIDKNIYIITPSDFKTNLLTYGEFEPCKVNNINGCFVYIRVKATNQLGRIHVSELENYPQSFTNPLDKMIDGNLVNAAIIGQVEHLHSLNRKNYKKNSTRLLEMSLVNRNCEHKESQQSLSSGNKIIAYVKELHKNSIMLAINPNLMASMDKIEILNYNKTFDFDTLKPGTALNCVVLSEIRINDKQLMFNVGISNEGDNIQLGKCYIGRIIKYLPNYAQLVKLVHGEIALLPITEVSDESLEQPQNVYMNKSTIECVVIDIGEKNIIVSTRNSVICHHVSNLVESSVENDIRSKIIRSVDDLGPIGSIHKGYIKHVAGIYATIMLSYNITTKVSGNEFKKWFSSQNIKSLLLPILATIKIISKSDNGVNVSIIDCKLKLKGSLTDYLTDPLVDPCNRKLNSSHPLIGKIIGASIQKIDTQLGLHLKIDNCVQNGFIPLTQISDFYTRFPLNTYKPLDTINILVIAQCCFKNILICTLRNTYLRKIDSCDKINTDSIINQDKDDIDYDNTFELTADQNVNGFVVFISPNYMTVTISLNVVGVLTKQIMEMIPQNTLNKINLGNLLALQVVRVIDKHHIEVCLKDTRIRMTEELSSVRTSSIPTKIVTASNLCNKLYDEDIIRDLSFLNSNTGNNTINQLSDEPKSCVPSKTFEKIEDKKFDTPLSEEKYIREREKAIVDGSRQTAEDYERECITNPNNSQCWIHYAAFVMEHTKDIEQSRHIIRRGLNTINYRDENDRFNMWICLLNLENEFGSEQSMDDAYKQAIQFCDRKKLFQRLTTIYFSTGKLLKAEEIHNILIKKHNDSKKSWLLYLQFLYQQSRCDDARKLLPRALRALDKKKHIDCLVKSGLLEFRYGDSQRACSIFDELLKNYPNRIDIWFVLIDQHNKQGKIVEVRNIFERLLSIGLKPKKMKSVFKKYADFEKGLTDGAGRFDYVQEKAIDYLKRQHVSS